MNSNQSPDTRTVVVRVVREPVPDRVVMVRVLSDDE